MTYSFQIIEEPDFAYTPWFINITRGISTEAQKRAMNISIAECPKEELGKLSFSPVGFNTEVKPVIFVGSSISWIEGIKECYYNDSTVRPILAANQLADPSVMPASEVTINRSHAMLQLITYLYNHGARKFALVGSESDSMIDRLRQKLYTSFMQQFGIYHEACIYSNDSGMADCLERFTRDAGQFDVVFFTNDILAICFAPRAVALGISIPRDLTPIGFGSLNITSAVMPQLTSFVLDFNKIGRYTITTALELLKKADILTLHTEINCGIRHGSTACISSTMYDNIAAMAYDNREYAALCYIDRLYASEDRINMRIIRAINENLTYEKISEMLFISESSLRYRIKNIFTGLRVHSKVELQQLTGKYMPMGMFGDV